MPQVDLETKSNNVSLELFDLKIKHFNSIAFDLPFTDNWGQ